MIERALRLALGAVLLYASWDKLLHPAAFAGLVKGYHLLPQMLVNPVAVWLPWLELTLGVCLWTGVMAEGALALSAGLLTAFWLALGVDFLRGIDVNCGCFSTSPDEQRAPMLFYLGRDALLLALAFAACEARLRLRRADKPQG
jgi:uncharacterized membrane protein YphA (DoxX/SURF4 family)